MPSPVTITGSLTQPAGRRSSITASFTTTVNCAQSQTWSAFAQPAAGKFAGGPATVTIPPVPACNMIGCATPSATAVIKLAG